VVDVKTEVDMATRAERRFDLPAEAPLDQVLPFEEVCARPELTPYLMIHTLSFRTEQLRACGLRLLEKTFYEDFEYVVKGTLDAADLSFVDLTVYRYLVGNAAQSVADASYVRRWADHERVTQEICALYERRRESLSPARAAYLFQRACLIVNTHYNIALIFDADRGRGLARARSFRWRLGRAHGPIARATQRRYLVARACHAAGVSSQAQLNALLRRESCQPSRCSSPSTTWSATWTSACARWSTRPTRTSRPSSSTTARRTARARSSGATWTPTRASA
jgi:hypothetical protein